MPKAFGRSLFIDKALNKKKKVCTFYYYYNIFLIILHRITMKGGIVTRKVWIFTFENDISNVVNDVIRKYIYFMFWNSVPNENIEHPVSLGSRWAHEREVRSSILNITVCKGFYGMVQEDLRWFGFRRERREKGREDRLGEKGVGAYGQMYMARSQ